MGEIEEKRGRNILSLLDKHPWFIVLNIILSVGGGTGAVIGYRHIDPPRDNPFTSIDADKLERRLDNKWQEKLSYLVHEHTQYRLDLKEIKISLSTLNGKITDLIVYVANLPPQEWQWRLEALEHARIRENPKFQVRHSRAPKAAVKLPKP